MIQMWNDLTRDFIQAHLGDDTATLLLAAHKWPGVDMPFAASQIEARRRLREKLPEWCACPDMVAPGRVPAEQCSSEATARYKRRLVEGNSLCDLTGGMGVDFWYMSEGMERAVYTERDPWLCEVARHNFSALSAARSGSKAAIARNVDWRAGDGCVLPLPMVDTIYLDPHRRDSGGGRVYAIEDCEPNVVEWQDELLRHASTVIVKLSPMADITDLMRRLRHVTEAHVVAVRGECKELLVKMKSPCHDEDGTSRMVMTHCVDFLPNGTGREEIQYTFPLSDTDEAAVSPKGVEAFLYDPDVTLVKARAFGSLSRRYGIGQLHRNTRLFTSAERIPDFPGRVFEVDEVIPFSSRVIKQLRRHLPQANIAVRQFPLTADDLRRRTGIRDGGDEYLFAATLQGEGKVLIICHLNGKRTDV